MEEDIKGKLWQLLEMPILRKGMELVDLEWRRERSGWVLRIYIDKPGGVTIGDCARISEIISNLLDKENLIHHSYNLEVSSPGIERPLKKREHFERFKGEKAKITLKETMHGRKNLTGIIIGVEENILKFEVEGKVWDIDLNNIKKANLQPEISFK
ncbi:MAG: ribosome maturation factor RimP [Caldimicrobium sp.]